MSNRKVKIVSDVEMKHKIDQKATHPRANSLAESEKNVSEVSGQDKDTFAGCVEETDSGDGEERPATSGSSTATQLSVPSLSGYLQMKCE